MAFDCPTPEHSSPTWTLVDVARWMFLPSSMGGGNDYLARFKIAWIRHNGQTLRAAAKEQRFPVELLAGICWKEVGGDPLITDKTAYWFRRGDWSGPAFVDQHLATTTPPNRTSFGPLSMQLRTAAKTSGLNPDTLSDDAYRKLADCLEVDW